MEVLWVAKGLGPGGAEHLLVAAASRRADDVDITCAYVLPWKDHLAGELERVGVRTECLSARRRDWRWPLTMLRLVRSGEFDVVHVHSPLPGSVARIAVRTLPRSRRPGVVSTEHNRWSTHRLPTRLLNRLTFPWSDLSFAVTDEVKQSMGRQGRSTTVLRHGVDLAAVAAEQGARPEVRDELGIDRTEFVIGTVANFRRQKNYPALLHAAALLRDRGVPARVVAVGQGPDEAATRELHRRLDLGDRVILTGFRRDAVRVMAACDAFTLASSWEGLPVALMEATALGLPIVSTAVGGVAEEFTDGVDALLVPPDRPEALADAWERIIADDELRKRLGEASAERSVDFSIGAAVEVIEAGYRSMARPTSGGSAMGSTVVTATKPPRRDFARRSAPPAEIRPATPADRGAIIALLRRSMGGDDDPRYPDLFAWKHERNHFGPSPIWVAEADGRIIAVRAFMRWEFVRGGEVLRAVRAVDTATDPDHRGQGWFRALTMHGLDQLRDEGVDFVFNTPNDQSRPGYLAMGWREVGRPPVAVGFSRAASVMSTARSREPASRWSEPLAVGVPVDEWLAAQPINAEVTVPADVRTLTTNTSADYLRWRFAGGPIGYRVVADDDDALIVRVRRRGRAGELVVAESFGESPAVRRLLGDARRESGSDHSLRIGSPARSAREIPLPGGGPMLTWRAVNTPGLPPLHNWALTMGDIELF